MSLGALKLKVAQCNPCVGAVAHNLEMIRAHYQQAVADGAHVLLSGELALCGYPPEDLVLRAGFLQECAQALDALVIETAGQTTQLLIGVPILENGLAYNAVAHVADGQVLGYARKQKLPNYGVFDEMRVFATAQESTVFDVHGVRLGMLICEDMWWPEPAMAAQAAGADMLCVVNGSPYEVGKKDVRMQHARNRIHETGLPLLYVNLVGGQDELVFDGASFALQRSGDVAAQLPAWQDISADWHLVHTAAGYNFHAAALPAPRDELEDIYQAMVHGLRDYVHKNGFPGVVLGMSGGIDSALSAAVAVDALGAARVRLVMMPSPYTSQESLDDAAAAANLLGIQIESISIAPAMQAYDAMLADTLADYPPGITQENIQSRARGMILMAISNSTGHMVLSTGNKSEMSVGYATLYGDMCGGYSVLKDVYKTTVFKLCLWRNTHQPGGVLGPQGAVMPERIISKPPSAELRPDQKDEDSLPPYPVLDAILTGFIENAESVSDLVYAGYDPHIVKRVWQLLHRAEYKRRQAPPGVKISLLAFGRDRRYPITNGYNG
jgi:NAD+ synthase